ncbi:L-serine ammonia-lyase, iron-sulfur-dependent, subunit alpha [Shigella sonnei]
MVTAPTNGACHIVRQCWLTMTTLLNRFSPTCIPVLLAAGAIGALYESNASPPCGVGCQGEVGVACSMAAPGLAELLGGGPETGLCGSGNWHGAPTSV